MKLKRVPGMECFMADPLNPRQERFHETTQMSLYGLEPHLHRCPAFAELKLARWLFRLSPGACKPGLLVARQAWGTVVMQDFSETGPGKIAPPRRKIVISTVMAGTPAFVIAAARIRAEKDATGLERCVQVL